MGLDLGAAPRGCYAARSGMDRIRPSLQLRALCERRDRSFAANIQRCGPCQPVKDFHLRFSCA